MQNVTIESKDNKIVNQEQGTNATYWKAYETNAGHLYLYVWQGEKMIYAGGDFEQDPGLLLETIDALRQGEDPGTWDNHDEELVNNYAACLPYYELVADNESIYPDHMGIAAGKEFNITLD